MKTHERQYNDRKIKINGGVVWLSELTRDQRELYLKGVRNGTVTFTIIALIIVIVAIIQFLLLIKYK